MQTKFPTSATSAWASFRAVVAAALLVLSCGTAAAQDDAAFELHEASLWALDPTLEQANHILQYPSSMPGVVDSDRSRASDRGTYSPLGLITFHGQAVSDLEIDLRVQSGRFLAHWPPAQDKSGRLRWIELALAAEASAESRVASVDDRNWFVRARELESLWVGQGARAERFLTYDCELSFPVPVQLSGGPDVYQVANLSTTPLEDLIISVPTPTGRRIGYLANLPAAATAQPAAASGQPAAGPAQPPAANPEPAPDSQPDPDAPPQDEAGAAADITHAATDVEVTAEAAADAPEAVVDEAEAVVEPAIQPAEPQPANPAPAEPQQPAAAQLIGEAIEVTMSPPLAAGAPELAQARQALAAGLLKAGLTAEEAELLLSLGAESILDSPQLVVAFRLPALAIEERLPLVAYPAPKKTVRVALVLVRNIDPSITDEVQLLVAQLGDLEYTRREAAEKRLLELGRLALPAVKAALKSDDLEIVFRCERILLSQNEKIDGT